MWLGCSNRKLYYKKRSLCYRDITQQSFCHRLSHMGVGSEAFFKIQGEILKINSKTKVIFLVSSGKKRISPILASPLEKFWINPLVPPTLEKSFRGPCSLTSFTAQMAGCETCSRLFYCWSYCVTIVQQ